MAPLLGGAPGGGTIKLAQRGCRSEQSEQTWFSGLFMSNLSLFFIAFWSSAMMKTKTQLVVINDYADQAREERERKNRATPGHFFQGKPG